MVALTNARQGAGGASSSTATATETSASASAYRDEAATFVKRFTGSDNI
jgi:hypothetical protein